jgi:hypothetical protein
MLSSGAWCPSIGKKEKNSQRVCDALIYQYALLWELGALQ